MLKVLIRCLSLQASYLAIGSALAGWGCAILTGNFNFIGAIFCLLFAVLAVLSANVLSVYFDEVNHGGFSLQVTMMQPGFVNTLSVLMLREMTVTLLCITALVGIGIVVIGGVWAVGVGIILTLCVYYLNCSPNYAFRKIWGLLVTFFFFGPVAVFGTYLCQKMHNSGIPMTLIEYRPALFVSISIGLLACASLLLYDYVSINFDREHKNRTFAAVLGCGGTKFVYLLTVLGAFASLWVLFGICPYLEIFNWESITPLVFLVFYLVIFFMIRPDASSDRLILLQRFSQGAMCAMGIYIFILFWILSLPDQEPYQYFTSLPNLIDQWL